jgi:hypothetical protein
MAQKTIEATGKEGRKIVFHLFTDKTVSFAVFRETDLVTSTHFVYLDVEKAKEFAKGILNCENLEVA